ncbi:hypothetical protein TP47_02960 [Xanthomonas citri pv. aurantifolii]|nr:hypothetical protein TP37_00875 [Xanthomonas citri pv. aurantifolii]KGK65719.1 hypothetical protein NB99_12490 [Xanthomonas citri pv. fuscans]KGP29656.1 hypothetical protein NY65_09045 [Xanthomonas phaseoli pv. phaseoli]AMV01177.1 hypothetical protein TP50_00860 [Xanthomonas citri pv. aurantifolii]KGP35299.1 hypothetical protein NY64_10575 [Xanthomonas citri pv. fuscans]
MRGNETMGAWHGARIVRAHRSAAASQCSMAPMLQLLAYHSSNKRKRVRTALPRSGCWER